MLNNMSEHAESFYSATFSCQSIQYGLFALQCKIKRIDLKRVALECF